ncbi:hypothetical protein G9A89_017107 [Geosiphon pyriformis]|nr:hypothetical protein G9A89_017107 [Geosiphon pyriformis]
MFLLNRITLFDGIEIWIIWFQSSWKQMFSSGLASGYMDANVAIVMNRSLAKHMYKISEIPGCLLCIRLLFKNKLLVSILGLYAGVSLAVQFFQADEINCLIAKAVNEFSFVILSGDFNEDGFHMCASFKKCFDLGLMIDYVFVSLNLVNAIIQCNVFVVSKHFDMDHKAVSMSLGLGGFLDMQLHSLYKQANKNCWKFDVKNANDAKWGEFSASMVANAVMFSGEFSSASKFLDLEAMWNVIHKIIVLSADRTFKKRWLKGFDGVFTKVSSRFHKLKLLVSKLVKTSRLVSRNNFASLLKVWNRLNSADAFAVRSLFLSGSNFGLICSALVKARKLYHSSKLLKSKHTEKSSIKRAINKRMESFEVNKGHTIRSVLEHPFCKMVLDHLIVRDELILEPKLVKSKVDEIMKGWTRKHKVISNISDDWAHQYQSLDYVYNGAFSGVMCLISFDEMSAIVNGLSDGKTTGFSVLNMLLVLLNYFLVNELIPKPWRNAWVLMIPKPYEWKGVLMNIYPIALIKTAHKIFSKVFLDRISLACSMFDVLHGDNISILKGTITQSPIFAVGSVVENVLEKNQELWLVLQDMRKAYNSVVFGGIHNGHVNRVITDFGLTDGYHVYDRLDQGKVFLPLLWCIFYDSLLCKVKKQEDVCVGRSQAATQHILDIANKLFRFNDILINNDKMIAIPINCQVVSPRLIISGTPISIVKKGESHHYLGIFLFSEGLSKPSLAKAQFDMWFFVNLVLRKAISNKQCTYLVSAVLFPIISYRTQFSFVPISVCNKWDALMCKILKSKSELPRDFPNNALYYPSFKSASIVVFANSTGVLARVGVSPSNNFLAGVVRIFSRYDLFLGSFLACAFCCWVGTSMSLVLGEPYFFKCVSSLRQYEIAFVKQLYDHKGNVFSWSTFKRWKRLDPCGPVPFWFDLSIHFLSDGFSPSICSSLVDRRVDSDVCYSHDFGAVCSTLLTIDTSCLFVYMDRSLCSLSTVNIKAGAAIFFKDINSGLGVGVFGLVFSTLIELQAITLALECVPFFRSVDLFSDNQTTLDVYKSESLLVKSHSGISGNKHADTLAKDAALSALHLSHLVSECFLSTSGTAVSGNSKHFKIGSGSWVVVDSLHGDINWSKSSLVWCPNSYLAAGFTSVHMVDCQIYFMKTLHYQLPVAVCKHLYDKGYSSVMCLYCGNVEVLDHIFFCPHNAANCAQLLDTYALA